MPLHLLTAPLGVASFSVDGSAAAHAGWSKAALIAGYQNSDEMAAHEIYCADLPEDLVGTYFRNGPARFVGYDGRKVRHPFDADGMVTGVSLDGRKKKAIVRQRYVATDGAIAERRARRSLYPGIFGNPMPLWGGGASIKNLANTNVLYHAGRLLALYEGCRPHLIDPLSLATHHEWDVDGVVGSGMFAGFSAHPRAHPDGSLSNFASAPNLLTGTTTVRFWDFNPNSYKLRAPAQVHELPGYGLFHDFLVTENWYILLAPPAAWGSKANPMRTFKSTVGWAIGRKPLTSMIEFDTDRPTVAHFIPRGRPHAAASSAASSHGASTSAQPLTIELDTFFGFHHANAYEDEQSGTVVIDTVAARGVESLPKFETLSGDEEPSLRATWGPLLAGPVRLLRRIAREDKRFFFFANAEAAEQTECEARYAEAADDADAPEPECTAGTFVHEDGDYEADTPRSSLTRYTVHLQSRTFKSELLSPRHVEFPSVAPRVAGAPHRYVYCTPGSAVDAVTPQRGVLKTDTVDPSCSQIWLPPSEAQYCGEAIFTPRVGEGGVEEDDGYLLTLCFDGRDSTSSLLILDARDVAAGPVARMPLSEGLDASHQLSADAAIVGPGHGLHATFVAELAPSLADVQASERRRVELGAKFLSDIDENVV